MGHARTIRLGRIVRSRFAGSGLYPDMDHEVERIYQALRAGGLALVPTDVGYGLVGLGEQAVHRIYELKGRPSAKPCVAVGNLDILSRVARPLAPGVRDWIEDVTKLTPLAVIAPLDDAAPLVTALSPYVAQQATHAGTIALFFSAGRIVERLADRALADGRLVIGSSANTSGTGNNPTLDDVPTAMRDGVDLVVDRGPAWYRNDAKLASTILDLATGRFLRQGVNYDRIAAAWERQQSRVTSRAA